MTDYKRLGNYVLFEELNPDSLGKNFRVGEIENNKIKNHFIMSEVQSMLYSNPKMWKRVTLLLEGIKKSNIPGLYSPDKILSMGEKRMLVFPYLNYKSFDSVLEDSISKGIPINFDLAFSIAIAISDLLDNGSSIVISGQKSSHGLLTPNNILIDFEGKIYLKNYGICPYLDKDESIFSGMEKQYGSWLTPEFIRREKIVPQSDIYHLGYLMFKMLTGQYFSYTPGEDFDSKLANISFSQHIHESKKDFLVGLQDFFKKTLHPDPSKRFANSREFKEFVSKTFNIEELSSVTFNLAYFMDSLYSKERNDLQARIEQEKLYTPPVKKVESTPGKVDTELVETILSGLEERNSKPKLYLIVGIILVALISAGSYFFIQSNKSKSEKLRKAEQIRLRTENDKKVKELQEKLKAIEEKASKSEEEKRLQEEAKQKLLLELEKEKKEKERLKKIEEDVQKKEEEQKKIQAAEEEKRKKEEAIKKQKALEEKKRLEEIERKKREEEALKPKRGDLLPLSEVDKKPVKISGKSPVFAPSIRSRYAGNKFSARIMCLIDESGTVLSLRVLNNVPKEIKKSIEKSIKKWKFSPAEKKGVQVRVWYQLNIKISI